MKFGPRTPNLSKSFKARTTGKAKRKIKSTINPLYGKKGMGWVNNPKKAAYNKIYNKTSFDTLKPIKKMTNNQNKNSSLNETTYYLNENSGKIKYKVFSVISYICSVSSFFIEDESIFIKLICAIIFFFIGKKLWEKSKPEITINMSEEELFEFSNLTDEEKLEFIENIENECESLSKEI